MWDRRISNGVSRELKLKKPRVFMPNRLGEYSVIYIGLAIKEFRLAANLSQKGLAVKTRILRTNISRIENGRNIPTLELLCRFVNAFGISMEDLFLRAEHLSMTQRSGNSLDKAITEIRVLIAGIDPAFLKKMQMRFLASVNLLQSGDYRYRNDLRSTLGQCCVQ